MPRSKTLRILIAGVVLFFISAYFIVGYIRYLGRNYMVPILMYHAVRAEVSRGARLIVSAKSFERQMGFLKERHYNVISLEELADMIKEKIKIPPKTIAITFDDGYWDNYTYAYPVLKKYNLPATIFLITNEVDNMVGLRDKLTWENVILMQNSGLITFGSHSLSHRVLTQIKSADDLKNEIFDSKRILEEKLGRKVNTFCYPKGVFNQQIKRIVKEAGYKVAVATSPGRGFSNEDVFALKRLRISEKSGNLFIFWVQISGYYSFIKEKPNGY
ncbi:MAG: polysaccharide deacetylase family protein [Candidatus Omnitrophota bacterium]